VIYITKLEVYYKFLLQSWKFITNFYYKAGIKLRVILQSWNLAESYITKLKVILHDYITKLGVILQSYILHSWKIYYKFILQSWNFYITKLKVILQIVQFFLYTILQFQFTLKTEIYITLLLYWFFFAKITYMIEH